MGVFLILTYFKVYVNENLCFFHNVPFGVDSRMLLWYHIFEKNRKAVQWSKRPKVSLMQYRLGRRGKYENR